MNLDDLIAEARKAQNSVYLAAPEPVAADLSRIIKGLADDLEASRPRVVETAEELDALPVDSVVIDFAGIPRIKRRGDSHMAAGWTHAGRDPISSAQLADGRSMTVLHEPREG